MSCSSDPAATEPDDDGSEPTGATDASPSSESSGAESSSGATDGTTGGDSPAPASGTYESGSRLHAQIIDGGDGAVQFVRWFDTELELDCDFARTAHGLIRCLPVAPSQAEPRVYFTDDACSDPIGIAAEPLRTIPAFISNEPAAGCPGQFEVRVPLRVVEPRATPDVVYQIDDWTGECAAQEIGGTAIAFTLARPDPGEFVGAQIVVEARGPDLDVEILVADDGARQLAHTIDRDTEQSCAGFPPETGIDGTLPCLPVSTADPSTSFWADATCSDPIAYTCKPIHCPNPTHMLAIGGVCPAAPEGLWELGAEQSTVYTDGETCSEMTVPIGMVCPYYEIAAERALDSLPALTLTGAGAGRLRTPTVTVDDGTVGALAGFWDTELDAYCDRASFADDVVRCLPSSVIASVSNTFADAACSDRLAQYDGCAVPELATSNALGGGVLTAVVQEVRSIAAKHDGDVYSFQNGFCVPIENETDDYWALDPDPLSFDVFAGLDERLDP